MDADQRQKLADLYASTHVLVLATQGEDWPTGHFQAFGQTDDLDLVVIMQEGSEKFQNLLKRPHVTAVIDNRDRGDVTRFEVIRATVQGVAREVPRGSAEWERLKGSFLQKNPFEEPFFGSDAIRMVRISPKRISYANARADRFKVEL